MSALFLMVLVLGKVMDTIILTAINTVTTTGTVMVTIVKTKVNIGYLNEKNWFEEIAFSNNLLSFI